MVSKWKVDDKFFDGLVAIDEAICQEVAAGGCPRCGGPLYRADYPRKPRGGLLGRAGEVFSRRISLCCGRQGCRQRATPPSVRFLGRRVYLGVVVLLAGVLWCDHAQPEAARETGVPRRTVGRWRNWWQSEFPHSRLYQEQRGRFLPPLSWDALPAELVERFAVPGGEDAQAWVRTLRFLSPLTTGSAGGAQEVRDR